MTGQSWTSGRPWLELQRHVQRVTSDATQNEVEWKYMYRILKNFVAVISSYRIGVNSADVVYTQPSHVLKFNLFTMCYWILTLKFSEKNIQDIGVFF